MKSIKSDLRLYAVTDQRWTGKQSLVDQVKDAIKGGVTCVQLREKSMDDQAFLAEALIIKDLCQRYHIPLFINDNVDVAIACQADGIHVGQEDMASDLVRKRVGPDMLIGVSVHSVAEALIAVENGADCLGYGAMFATATKDDADVLTIEGLRQVCAAVDIPVVAIGGIDHENIGQLAGTGIAGVAIISAIFGASDIEKASRDLKILAEQIVDSDLNNEGGQ